jgi:hypothetical protein
MGLGCSQGLGQTLLFGVGRQQVAMGFGAGNDLIIIQHSASFGLVEWEALFGLLRLALAYQANVKATSVLDPITTAKQARSLEHR